MPKRQMPISCDRLQSMARELYTCVHNDMIVKAKFILKDLNAEVRQLIVSTTFDGNAPLFIAAQQGLVHFVHFLLEECYANVEQCGVYEVQEDRSKHVVTPLWCAAVSNKLEVVRILIKHHANVNAMSDTKSTPVRSACYTAYIDVVKCLIENGADIHVPNIHGGTCLINSVPSSELCKLLIDKGAQVNAQDNSGNLALHYAVREGCMETVKLLLKHGSKPFTVNDMGDDALRIACLKGHSDILQYLIKKIKPSLERIIESYELIGANYVDEKHDIQNTIQMWRAAMTLRYMDPDNPKLVDPPTEPSPAYNNAVEPRSMEDLDHIIQSPDAIYMQALKIRERVLGADHKDTIFGLMYRGAVYADIPNYHRCIDLWKYAFTLRHKKQEPLNHDCLFTLQELTRLFWEIQDENKNGQTNQSLKYIDIIDVIKMAIHEIASARELMDKSAGAIINSEEKAADTKEQNPFGYSKQREEYNILLQLLLHLIHLVCELDNTEEQIHEFSQLIHSCLITNPRDSECRSLLHLAVSVATSFVSDEHYSTFPSVPVIQTLLNCGADVDAVDNNGNTALHLSAMLTEELKKPILNILLQYGAHIDIRNNEGSIVIQEMTQLSWRTLLDIDPQQYVSLKCLAARSIKKYAIPFEGEIPTSLVPFIALH